MQIKKNFAIPIFLPRVLPFKNVKFYFRSCQKPRKGRPGDSRVVMSYQERSFRGFPRFLCFASIDWNGLWGRKWFGDVWWAAAVTWKNDDEGISLHPIPYFDDARPEAVKKKTKMGRICELDSQEMDSYQVFGGMLRSFCARRLRPSIFVRKTGRQKSDWRRMKLALCHIHGFTVRKFKRYRRGITAW